MALPTYASPLERVWYYTYLVICGLVFLFLIAPILIVIPLSFNAEAYFTFTPKMLALDPEGYSLKHFRDFLSNPDWTRPLKNSFIIAPLATIISVSLGTLAAIGLSQSHVPGRRAIMAILISPMIVPLIISATGMFFFYSKLGIWMEDTVGLSKDISGYIKVVLAHSVLGIPFVIITVTATLVGFDRSLTRAAANMGAGPVRTFFKVQMPLIMPGVISGALFAFITSFDEVVVVLFVGSASQKTLPWQMFTGLREQISPTILAVAAVLQQKGMLTIILILGLTGWTGVFRLIRAEYMKHKSREYVQAADAIGASNARRMFVHIFPNVSHVVLVQLSILVVGFIKAEVILSFLGFGVPVDVVSWGSMLNEAQNELILGKWWQLVAATTAMALLVTAFSLFTDALRDALDPKLKGLKGH